MSKLWHIATKDEIEDKLNTDFERGMTNEFAQSKVKQRVGSPEEKTRVPAKTAAAVFSSVMAILLVILSVIFMFTGKPVLGTVVVALVFVSEILGFAQDIVSYKKEQKARKLVLSKAVVIRAGQQKLILSDEVAQGDIVVLTKGDIAPCDGRITYAENVEVDEEIITKVSGCVKKSESADLAEETEIKDQINMIFAGSSIVSGNCRIVACEVGGNTVLAGMEKNLPKTCEKSYMQDKLSEVGKVLTAIMFVLLATLLAIAVASHADSVEAGMLCLALGAVLVPSKMSSVISYIANKGRLKIADAGALVKGENTAENLALCDVVITGKSGIITEDAASVWGVFTSEGEWLLNDSNLSLAEKSILNIILEFGAICTHPENEKNEEEGYAVDCAIVNAAKSLGIATGGFNVVKRYPFDMARKLMTAVAKTDGGYRIITKGSVREVLERSTHAVSSTTLDEMTDLLKESLIEKYDNASQNGFKTVAVAYKDTNELLEKQDAESGLTFVGAIVIKNEIRQDSVKALKQLISAGIKPVMATYDNAKLSEYIARQAGIMKDGDLLIDGGQLAETDDLKLDEKIENAVVFAQLMPDDKKRIIESFKRTGKTVCLISYSDCDAKALDVADVSVAKQSTTDVSARSAKVVTSGALSSFVNVMKQAQSLYLDVRKSLRFMISGAIAQMLFVLFAFVLTNNIPLAAVQVLAIGVLTAGILPFALPVGGEWEKLKLRNVKMQSSIFYNMWTRIILFGVFEALLALVIFIRVRYFIPAASDFAAYSSAQTAVFVFFILSAIFNIIYLRKNVFALKEGKKEFAQVCIILGVYILVVLVALLVEGVKNLLGFNLQNIGISVILSLLPVILRFLTDAFKFFKTKSSKTEEIDGAAI